MTKEEEGKKRKEKKERLCRVTRPVSR